MTFFIKGCRVQVNFYFFALLCLLSFADKSGLLTGGLFAAMMHEAGHLAVMLLLPGQAPASVTVTPCGLRIGRRPLAEFARGSLPVLAAGSAVNLTFAAAVYPFRPDLAAIHLTLGIINLLPVDSLDGGGMARLLLRRILPESAAEKCTVVLSLAVLVPMTFLGVRVLFRTKYNFTLLALSLWLLTSLVLRLMRKSG